MKTFNVLIKNRGIVILNSHSLTFLQITSVINMIGIIVERIR
jgi:hypothetical protein